MTYISISPDNNNKTKQTFLTQYTAEPYFEWEGNKFVEIERGIFKRIEEGNGLAGISQFIYKHKLDVNSWFAIITKETILIWHYGTIPDYDFLRENSWKDVNTHNKRCPFAEYFERREKR